MDLTKLRASLQSHEGCRLTAYADTRGLQTIGWGHRLSEPISQAAADQILTDDMGASVAALLTRYAWVASLDDVRQRVLAEMAYNLGVGGLSGFQKLLAAAELHDFATAAAEMLASTWASQVGSRAYALATRMRDGVD